MSIFKAARKWYNQKPLETFELHDFTKELLLLCPFSGSNIYHFENAAEVEEKQW